jgi:Pyruvate/2-oxoacid:ferredoxin oxidoreductase delta subunit
VSENNGSQHRFEDGKDGISRRDLITWFNPGNIDTRWGRLEVDEIRCSACALCARSCGQGSLVSSEADGHGMVLTYRGDLCDHCGECINVCPENALRHAASPGTGDPSEVSVLFRDEPARCPRCGAEIGSKAMVRCISQRIEKTDPVLAAKVQLCDGCRAIQSL